ncbi:hypothetical protein [uncultured Aquimarina sp.]|uniref:hypothetical protein n=1 Tax=uncultured Aquimarina sp. TaxID=575652 RepID=UPI002634542C|nr:hypothetical protein [uncultured Aquimarina sp.]
MFLPNAIDVDEENLRDNIMGNVTLLIVLRGNQYILLLLKHRIKFLLKFGSLSGAAAQRVKVDRRGRITFKGNADFSPERFLVRGSNNLDEAFPPLVVISGAVGDSEYSS